MNKKQIKEALSESFNELLMEERSSVMKNLQVSFHGSTIMILDGESELEKHVSFRSLIKHLATEHSGYSDSDEWFNSIADDFEKYARILRQVVAFKNKNK